MKAANLLNIPYAKAAFLRSLPLAYKLTLPFSIFIAGISVFIYLYAPAQYEQRAMDVMNEKGRGIVSITAFSVGPAFMFDDTASFRETIESLRHDPLVSFIVFIGADHRIVASFNLDEAERAGFRTARQGKDTSPDGRYLLSYEEVKARGRRLGELYVGLSLTQLHQNIAHAHMVVAVASFIFFMIGIVIVFAISSLATHSLAQMVRTAESITAGDLSSRAPVQSTDEVGHLAAAFNTMLDRLHTSYEELDVNNQLLEQRVQNRTAELEREVSVRQASENALRESEVFLHNSQKIAHLGSHSFDMATKRWQSSAILDEILGIDETYDRTLDGFIALVHPDFKNELRRCFQIGADKPERIDLKYTIIRRNDGTERWVHGLAEYETDAAGHTRMLGTIQDITESIRFERQLRQAQKLESLGTLAGGIAHDFNNLLSMILGSAELLRQHMQGDLKSQKYVDRIVEASERGASISRQLLIFSRPEQSEVKPVSIPIIISELEQMLTHFLPKSIAIDSKIDANAATILGDAGQIHQALLNLVLNAADAMDSIGKLTFGMRTVPSSSLPKKFNGAGAQFYAAVSIADTGEGMTESVIEKIFDPFFTTKPQGKGTGLGLAMVHGIMKHHHGFVDVTSIPGKGTTFTLYFPAAPGTFIAADSSSKETEGKQTGTILLVDDEMIIREMLTEYLEASGYSVLTASNGAEALEIFSTQRRLIDLVITDLGMPEMGGEELFQRLKKTDPQVRVLVSSGYLDGISQEHLIKIGVTDVLKKPFRFDQIRRIIETALSAPRPHQD